MGNRKETTGKGTKPLNERQERVAACLAAGMKNVDACRQCKVSEEVLYRWKKNPAFTERVVELRKEITQRAIDRMADAIAGPVIDRLLKLLDEAKMDSNKLEAAKTLIEKFIDLNNAADLKARIEAMEAELRGGQQ